MATMIIDAHTHLWKYEINSHLATPEILQAAMEKAGVKYALVIAGAIPHYDSLPSTEELVDLLKGHENLFAVAAVSPSMLTPDSLGQLDQLIQGGQVKGVKLYLGYEHFYPADERLISVYRLAESRNVPVIFHTGFFWDPDNKGLAKYANPLGVDEVAVLFPKLNIIIAHMGNPWIVDCAVVVQKNPNVYLDVSGYFTEFVLPFDKEEKRLFHEDVDRLHVLVGHHRKLLYGTDWPLCDMEEYVRVAQSLNLSSEEQDLFFWKNAIELFRLPIRNSRF